MLVDEPDKSSINENMDNNPSTNFLHYYSSSIISKDDFPKVVECLLEYYQNILSNKSSIIDKDEIHLLKQLLILNIFFPALENLEESFSLCKSLMDLSFRNLTRILDGVSGVAGVNSKLFFELFSKNNIEDILTITSIDQFDTSDKNELENQILTQNPWMRKIKDFILSKDEDEMINTRIIRDLSIINFISEYKIAFNKLKGNFLTRDSLSAKNASNYDEVFKILFYFQESFKSYFFSPELLAFIKSDKIMDLNWKFRYKMENMILTQVADIGKYFTTISSDFNKIIKNSHSYNYITHSNWLKFSDEIIKCLKSKTHLLKWHKLFDKNRILTSIITINYFNKTYDQDTYIYKSESSLLELIRQFNYANIFESYNKCRSLYNAEISKILVKCVSVYYLMFNADMNSYGFLISPEYKVYENVVKYNSDIINLLWNIKNDVESEESQSGYYKIKDEVEKLMNDIISNKEETMIYLFNNNFIEGMIKFILKNIESSHVSSKYIDDLIHSKNPEKILNGFLLLGYWANTYPIKYIYTRMLDMIYIMKKSVDLRTVLTTEENIAKFMKGVYLIFKAFPKLNEDQVSFINYLKDNLNYWISDYNLNSFTRKMVDRTNHFVEKVFSRSDYYNENTLFIKFENK